MLETSGFGEKNFRTLKFDGYLQIFFGKLKFSLDNEDIFWVSYQKSRKISNMLPKYSTFLV